MPKISHCISSRSEIVGVQPLHNSRVAFCTKLHGIKIIDIDGCEVLLKQLYKELDKEVEQVAFSADGEHLAFSVSNYIYIVNLLSHKLIKKITLDDKYTVAKLYFGLDSKQIIVATKSSKVFIYRTTSSSPISTITLSEVQEPIIRVVLRDEMMALILSSGLIVVVNLYTKEEIFRTISSDYRVISLCFVDNETLICGCDTGEVSIYNLKDTQNRRIYRSDIKKVSYLLNIPNSNYVIMHSKSNFLAIYEITSSSIVKKEYISFKRNLSDMILVGSQALILQWEEKSLIHVELPNQKSLRKLIDEEKIYEAFLMLEESNLLDDTTEAKELDIIYKERYSSAVETFSSDDKEECKSLIGMFKNLDSKAEDMQELAQARVHYSSLQEFYLDKDYESLYALCEEFKALKYTYQYRATREIYNCTSLELKETKLKEFEEKMYDRVEKIEGYLIDSKFKKAHKLIKKLRKVPFLKSKIRYLILELQTLEIIKDAFKNGNFLVANQTVDAHQNLKNHQISKDVKSHLYRLLLKCELLALDAKMNPLNKKLGDLSNLQSITQKTTELFKVASTQKIKKLQAKGRDEVANRLIDLINSSTL